MQKRLNVVASIGADIRSLRKSRQLTLVELAQALDRSVGWLSQVERGKSQPNLQDLQQMAETLDVSINSFFHTSGLDSEEGLIVRSDARRPIGSRTEGNVEQLLTPDLTDDFEALHATFAPHARLEEPLSRPTQEVCYVIGGRLDIWVDGHPFTLHAGDSFRLRGQEFQWANPYDEICEVIWIVSPPIY